jgi:hypothetical protein
MLRPRNAAINSAPTRFSFSLVLDHIEDGQRRSRGDGVPAEGAEDLSLRLQAVEELLPRDHCGGGIAVPHGLRSGREEDHHRGDDDEGHEER